jgi:RNA polymerase subunit RPABC4/transcription elongation factor Spt4
MKKLIPCPVCNTRNEYRAYKDKKAHAKKWTNQFTCPSCHTPLTQRWSTMVYAWLGFGFSVYLVLFTDFEYSVWIFVAVMLGVFLLLYFGLIFKVKT